MTRVRKDTRGRRVEERSRNETESNGRVGPKSKIIWRREENY